MLTKERYEEHSNAYIKGGVGFVEGKEAKSPPIGVGLGLSWLDGYNLAKKIKEGGINSAPDRYNDEHINKFIKEVEEKSNVSKENW